MILTVGIGAGLGVTRAVLDSLALAVLASILWQRVVTGTEGILHPSTTGPGTVSPGTPQPPATIDRSLKTPPT